MAKKLLLNVLVKVLGEFVELDENNLSLAVWSGQVVLSNLKLKAENIFRKFQVTIYHGSVKSLEITIPWASLLNSPLKIKLDGVLVDVGPQPLTGGNGNNPFLSPEQLSEMIQKLMEEKLQKLKMLDQYLELSHGMLGANSDGLGANDLGGGSESYVQQWTTRVIDNIELTFSNIHVRYEDQITIPGIRFATGITLESFIICTCDDFWQPAYVNKPSNGTTSYVNKLATIQSLGIYWEHDATCIATLPFEEWKSAMIAMIHARGRECSHLEYLLSPHGTSMYMKLVHYKRPPEGVPRFDIKAESNDLKLTMNNVQYHQVFYFLERMKKVTSSSKIHDPNSFRPQHRPSSAHLNSAKQWWHYAKTLVSLRPRYIRLIKLKKKAQLEEVDVEVFLSMKEMIELNAIEEKLPFDVLKRFRQRAMVEFYREHKEKFQQDASTKNTGWWSWSNNNANNANASSSSWLAQKDQEDISLDDLINEMNQQEAESSKQLFSSIQISLASSSTIILANEKQNIIECKGAISFSCKKMNKMLQLSCNLTDLLVQDALGTTPFHPQMISVKSLGLAESSSSSSLPTSSSSSSSSKKPTLSIAIENNAGKTKVKLFALPIEIFINKHCIQTLLSEFALPTNNNNHPKREKERPMSSSSKKVPSIESFNNPKMFETALLAGRKFSSQSIQEMVTKHKDDIEIIFEAHAPKIIIPEDSLKDAGYLLLDCGFLAVNGVLCSQGISFNMSLKAINAGLPNQIQDLYSLADLSLYLIKPFDVNMEIQSIDQSMADLTTKIELSPELRGEIDAVKLARLLRVVNGMSDTFSTKKKPSTTASVNNTLSAANSNADLLSAQVSPLRAQTNFESSVMDTPGSIDDMGSDGFMTPMRLSLLSEYRSSFMPTLSSFDDVMLQDGELLDALSESAPQSPVPNRQSTGNNMKSPSEAVSRNPLNVDMRIGFTLPKMALDLTYNTELGHHIVFAVEGLQLDVVNRPYDRRIVFDMSDMSIEDSFRAPAQRFVAWTPRDDDRSLVTASYLSILDKKSPLYNNYATEIAMTFADLRMNVDVNTVNNLKPFFEVLLNKKGKGVVVDQAAHAIKSLTQSSKNTSDRNSDEQRKSIIPFTSNTLPLVEDVLPMDVDAPVGTKIEVVLEKISLDIFRTFSSLDQAGMMLDTAFSMSIINMRLDIDMMDLMSSVLRLKTFEIVDTRGMSKDYVFRHIFCPTVAEVNPIEELPAAKKMAASEEVDLLHLTFTQESKSHSFITVVVSGITSFVAIDAILDFAVIASGNFFALTGLFSSSDNSEDNSNNNPPNTSSSGGVSRAPQHASNSNNQVDAFQPMSIYTMNATVKMVNSRLILLEDPAMIESRAIVGQCAVEVHYTKETRNGYNRTEVFESVHVTVSDNEVFVLKSMKNWNPLPILEPFDVEFHLKRNQVNGEVTLTSLQAELDKIEARLSFNDLLLGHSILSRRSLAQQSNNNTTASSSKDAANNTSTNNSTRPNISRSNTITNREYRSTSMEGLSSPALPTHSTSPSLMVRFGLTSLTVVIVNDFHATAIPVLKLLVDETSFFAEGMVKELKGEGSAQMKIDYFNSPILAWEPFLDNWKPTCRIYSEQFSNIFEIRSDHTLQLTLSGAMLETLLRSYSLFFHEYEDLSTRGNASDITVVNDLGDNVDVDIYDSNSKKKITDIKDGQANAISSVNESSKKTWKKLFQLPNAVDIELKGPLTNQRLPLVYLPFNIAKPKACLLQPLPQPTDPMASPASQEKGNQTPLKPYVMEPIEEEVYENSRYDPITGRWKKPFFIGDPYEWTDASALVKKDIESVEIHSDKWEWSGKWEADMDGVIGIEIDEEGWEYAPSFSFFSMVSPRRNFQPLDGVRRRRWTRTRVPKLTEEVHRYRPLTVFWDVQTLSTGTRHVVIRSGFQIINELGFDLFVSLQHPSWPEDYIVGPIAAGATFNVPLLRSFAAMMKYRPVEEAYDWSPYYPCNIHSYDFKVMKDIACHHPRSAAVCFRSWSIRENKSLLVRLVPYIILQNKLLCNMHYRCLTNDGEVESNIILSGLTATLNHVNVSNEPRLSFQIGTFDWSVEHKINRRQDNVSILELRKMDDVRDILPICIVSKINASFSIEVDVFFKVAMIDRTGLQLLVKSQRQQGRGEMTRGFNTQGDWLLSNASKYLEAHNNNSNSSNSNAKAASPDVKRSESPLLSGKTSKLIEEIHFPSVHSFEIAHCEMGAAVYSDASFKWCHLPACLRGHTVIKLPLAERYSRSSQFFSFTLTVPSMVFILTDAKSSLHWLKSDGYLKTSEIAVARRISKGQLIELNYSVYGKLVEGSKSQIVLRGSWDKSSSCMYSVVIVPLAYILRLQQQPHSPTQPTQPSSLEEHHASVVGESKKSMALFEQILHIRDFSLEVASLCWTEGCKNIMAYYTEDNLITVRCQSDDDWSDEISIDTSKNSTTKGSFQIDCMKSGIIYHLSYSMENLPGLYHKTQFVTFMPRFCILNCMDESLFVAQKGSAKHMEFHPHQPEGWHVIDARFGFEVKLRTQSTIWSLGAVVINEIGSSVLYIPYSNPDRNSNNRGLVLHVEVKLADPQDNCSLIVVIWRETIESQGAMSIDNDTEVPITIRQANIEHDHDLGDTEYLYELTIPPGKHFPFGWTDPDCGTNIMVAVGSSLQQASKRIAKLNMLKDGQRLRLPYLNSSTGLMDEVVLVITTSDAGHVLHVSKSTIALHLPINEDMEDSNNVLNPTMIEDEQPQQFQVVPLLGLNIVLSSFGISLVVEKPTRRELMSLYVDGMEVLLKSKGAMKTLEFTIMDMQLDNYSESMIYPILLRSKKKEIHRSVHYDHEQDWEHTQQQSPAGSKSSDALVITSEESEKPFMQLSVVQDQPNDAKRPILKYVAFRVLSLAIQVDSATMQIMFLDLLDDLKILTSAQAMAITLPQRWLAEFNQDLLSPDRKLIDIHRTKQSAQQSKMYIKNLIIHPMKITVTFFQSTFPRRQRKDTLQSTVLNAAMSLVGVEKLQLRLNSFEVEDAMESIDTLVALISTKTMQDLRSQLTQIAGSLALIGSPIGFARKVGSGVKAFFYEPYLGAVHGSTDFVLGLRKGTDRLIRGVVTGAMDSTAAFVGTASRGISYLSGDIEYVRKRAEKRQQQLASPGGIYAGFKNGGESIFSGFASGVTGLVSKPFEEAAKGGVQGFIKGLGLGVLGAAVKPLVGLTEGISSIAYGISSQVDPSSNMHHVRPPRALEPSLMDPSLLVISPLNLDAAYAMDFVMKRARQNNYEDSFLCYIPLESKGEAVILSDVYIFWRKAKSLWGRVWPNISHCVYMGNAIGIMLYSGAMQGNTELVVIPCHHSKTVVRRLYTALTLNAHRMGNPSKVVPVDLIDWDGSNSLTSSTSLSTLASLAHSSAYFPGRHPPTSPVKEMHYNELVKEAAKLGELEGYRFGSVNGKVLPQVNGNEHDIILHAQARIQRGCRSWQQLDESIWQLLWEWGCIHANLAACRCCTTLLINHSDSPIQVTRVQMLMGRNVVIIGSESTGYEPESRLIWPRGYVVIFTIAFPQSPLEIGHLKAKINSVAFTAILASTQRETSCEAKGGFTIGFLEKTVSEWWCKYVVHIS